MTRLSEHRSIVAVDPTTEGLTYAFFEDGRLTYWQSIVKNGEGDLLAILDRALDGCAADILVIEDPAAEGSRRHPNMRALLKRMAMHARERGFRVKLVPAKEVRLAWRARGARNKQAVAAKLAECFPELLPLVPPPRKNYMSEDERTHVFAAVALAAHAYGLAELVR